MESWSRDWIIANYDYVFNEDFLTFIFHQLNKSGIDEEKSWDLTINVAEKIYSAIEDGNYRGSSENEFYAYVNVTIKNTKIDYFRKQNALNETFQEIILNEGTLIQYNIYETPVDEYVINKIELENTIELLSKSLTDEQWEVLSLTAQGLNSPEIAKLMDKSPEAVRKQLERGRRSARKLLDNQDESF